LPPQGEMAEWSNAAVLKTVDGFFVFLLSFENHVIKRL